MISRLLAHFSMSANISNTVEVLLELAESFGLDKHDLEADVRAMIEERLALWLVGNVRVRQNYRDRQGSIRRRFAFLRERRDLADDQFEGLVSELASVQARIATARRQRRTGAGNLDETTSDDLFLDQSDRCAVCGVPLKPAARHSSARFSDGREPLGEGTLDHIVPFYLVGNETKFEYLCRACNVLKNDRLGVHEDGLVVSGNTLRPRDSKEVRKRSIFWTCYKHRRCFNEACEQTPVSTILYASCFDASIPFMLGNIRLSCEGHAPEYAVWIHDENLNVER
jgi:hypothetical protein